ncbi:alpha/beta hydrolase [Streptomyces phyllanthi]|uniref:Alpha/beta hydrolase n=1 Tax=Streptomyces phyllanthi TaxID=1803180 RepID=A0A5N8W7X4_9ACTN|nr:alpha/beta hydrolase [Streptomyces phyllanthi]MPY43419.1 alpha/beta hydrolase [Streptomyces phyllanthi]
MTKIKRNAALLAASAVVMGLTTPFAAATTSASPEFSPALALGAAPMAPEPPLDWVECEGQGLDPRQECATVEVPMDYAAPHGRKITLALSRIPAENHRKRRGVLLMIPGGPGGGSLDAPSGKGQKLPQDVRDTYDLIGFDPRGYGRSTPVSCELEKSDLALTKLRPWPAPDGSVTGNMATARRMADACARNGGELIRHISTANEARDLDRIRAALGERKISAWGVSYGTYVGAVYNQLFPHRTDRVVLDSNDDPDPTRVARGWLAMYETGVEDNFPEFATWASTPGNPDRVAATAAEVRPLFLRLAARLDREPIPWPGANPEELNGNVLRQTMLDTLYDPDRYPTLARMIQAARKGTVPPVPQGPPDSVLQNSIAAGAAICNDVAWPRSAAVYERGVAESRAEYPLTAGLPRSAMICAAWPDAPKEPAVRITDRGPSNVLLIQNRRDVATPLSGALKLRAALGRRAVMVTVDSTGHGAYLANGNACGDRTASRFLATGERPAGDVTCD